MYRIVIIGILVFSSLGALAQTKINFAWYDKYTYELYQNKDWDKLIVQSNKAIKAGHDFYYLRMRIGIAYYTKGQYRASIPHFTKALEYNDSDPLTAEYLFFAYKFSGRSMDANLIYAKYKKQLKSREIPELTGFITSIYSEGGIKVISPSNDNYGTLNYIHAGVQQQLGSRINLYHGYMRISQNIYNYESINNPGFRPPTNVSTKFKYAQDEYYLKAIIPLTLGVQLIGSLHTQAITDSISYNNFAYTAGINASFKLVDLYVAYGSADIKSTLQQQFTGGLTIYPAKNQNFYLRSALIYHLDENLGNMVFYQKIGLRTGENTWLEMYGSFGDMKNVQELDGFYQYNINNHLIRRIGFTGIFGLSPKAKLFVGYTSENYEEIDTLLPYKQHYLFAGLQINIKN
ncbi:MAG: hypothetical protein DRI71_05615 [Bacteroidetes bacterium]|nr:MAG: hypothetical protein DRI71_05615 [Bacteroidota bacterium]